jgi:hypothetical protein
MKIISLLVLLPLTAFAGGKGALRALDEVQDAVADSEAECAKKLGRKLESLAADVEDGVSSRKLKEQVREVRGFAEDRCPKKLATKVKRALEKVLESDDDDDEGDDRSSRRRRSREEDDEEEAPAPRRRAVARDCGTGQDPGCTADAMDAVAFRGLVSSLTANSNEYTKLDLLRNAVGSQRVTAAQLGPVLDQFQNEYLKLDAAKAVVPRLVDPSHALGHASKFRNSFIAADFSKLLAK